MIIPYGDYYLCRIVILKQNFISMLNITRRLEAGVPYYERVSGTDTEPVKVTLS